MKIRILIALVLLLAAANFAFAQTTEFTYQGRLVDGTMPANASYDFEFRLYDVETGGTDLRTITRLGVPVSNGTFTVLLDFANRFPGAARWIEIAVKPAGGASYTTLNPRQSVTSAPYSIRSMSSNTAATADNALNLGGVGANQFVITTDPRMTDARDPLPGSVRYVQNGLTQQSASNFNITGDGTAGGTLSGDAVNSTTQYNIGGSRVLITSSFSGNIFAGNGAGASNGSGGGNSFFGNQAGQLNVTGGNNSFFGKSAGNSNTASNNSFFGEQSGFGNSTGANNSHFGQGSGRNNSTGSDNAFFGFRAGFNNAASGNSFFGSGAGDSVTLGANNVFFGSGAGTSNMTGSNNTVIGAGADVVLNNLTFATAIGAGATVNGNNLISIGRSVDNVRIVGDLVVNGTATVSTIGSGGAVQLCSPLKPSPPFPPNTLSGLISTCSSSLRYKTDVQTFFGGLDIVRRLRPIAFTWKDGGMHDVGFAAEEVEQVEPLLTTRNDKGEIEGVKYAQITSVLVNAAKEQQQIIEQQQRQIDALKKLVCLSHPQADVCKQK